MIFNFFFGGGVARAHLPSPIPHTTTYTLVESSLFRGSTSVMMSIEKNLIGKNLKIPFSLAEHPRNRLDSIDSQVNDNVFNGRNSPELLCKRALMEKVNNQVKSIHFNSTISHLPFFEEFFVPPLLLPLVKLMTSCL